MIPLFFYIIIFQLTRSRGAWLASTVSCDTLCISTHTLTWSVTIIWKCGYAWWFISTHTLTWSVTHFSLQKLVFKKFQLTRSRGAWLSCLSFFCSTLFISTHTLTWSVTYGVCLSATHLAFQLTRSRGAWHPYYTTSPWKSNFNSHAHVERDHCSLKTACIPFDFNSHAHVERDLGA